MALRYKYPNTYIVYRTIKQIMKDEERGALTREDAALLLHEAADILVTKIEVSEQLRLVENGEELDIVHIDDVAARVQAHLNHPARKR